MVVLTLKEFIQETLQQITDAVSDFTKKQEGSGADANPIITVTKDSGFIMGDFNEEKNTNDTVMPIDFDVAVTAEDKSTGGVSGGIRVVSVFKAEGGTTTEASTGTTSRVKFRIPLKLPETGAKRNPRDGRQRVVKSSW